MPTRFHQQRGAVPIAAPERLLDTFMRQGGHGKPCVGDPEAAFFLRKQCYCGVNSLPLCLGSCPCSRAFCAMSQDQLMNCPHGSLGGGCFRKCKWDSTDTPYSKVICTLLLVSSVESPG